MKRISTLLLALLTLSSCYEDKGNYDYKDIQELTVSIPRDSEYSLGDMIEIETTVTPSIDDDLSNYTIEWYIDDETRDEWNGSLKFEWEVDMITTGAQKFTLAITDNRTDVTYYSDYESYITLNSPFVSTYNFLILSDDGGDSKLGYVAYTERTSRPDPVIPTNSVSYPTAWKVYYDVYATQNGGKKLGTGPISIQEHYRTVDPDSDASLKTGQYCIFQQSGAIDIDRDYLQDDVVFSDMFDGGAYPAGMEYLASGSMMRWLDVMTDQRGQVYTRFKGDDQLYNSGEFGAEPIEYEDAVLSNCTVYRNPYNLIGGAMIHDPDNGRMLLMYDGGNVDSYDDVLMNAGKIIVIPEPYWAPEGYRTYDELEGCEVLAMNARQSPWYDAWLTMIYRETATGDYYLQRDDLYKDYSGIGLEHMEAEVYKLYLPGEPQKVFICGNDGNSNSNYIFFAIGEKLYLIDLDSGSTTAELYYTADSEITAIFTYQYQIGNVFIGTEGGFLYDLDVSNAKNKVTPRVSDEDKTLFKLGGFNKIVDIIRPLGVDNDNYK